MSSWQILLRKRNERSVHGKSGNFLTNARDGKYPWRLRHLTSSAYGSVSFEISAEAVSLVELGVNAKSYQSVYRFKLLAAATITQLKLIPATEPAGNVNDAVLDVLASLKDVVALAEASTDF